MVVETSQTVPKFSQSTCFSVVSKKLSTEDFAIVNFKEESFGEIHGFLGEHSMLKVEIKRNGLNETFSFFVKSLPTLQSQQNFLSEMNGFFKEKQFFTRYCPLLKQTGINILDQTVPCCYFVDNRSFIFEDLGVEGFKTFVSRAPLKIGYIKAALTSFAKLHASGLILEEKKSFRLLDDFEEELKESFYCERSTQEIYKNACKTGISALVELTDTQNSKISRDLFEEKALEGCDLQKMFVKPSTKFRNTLCHADPWTKNMLFKCEEGKASCVLVDFQTYRYGPPAQDVMSFLYLVTDRKMRDEYMEQLLEFYYGELRGGMEKFGMENIISKEEFFESCQYFRQFALTQAITHFQVVLLSEEILSESFAEPERLKSVIFGDRYEFLKKVWHKDPVFKQRSGELLEELREFYEIQTISSE